MNTHNCPRRSETFGLLRPAHNGVNDHWRADGTCSYCGSLSPERFLELAESGVELGPTDKNYKVYVGTNEKFYFKHLSEEQMLKFIDLSNSRKLKLGYPGRFYVLPFFMRFV